MSVECVIGREVAWSTSLAEIEDDLESLFLKVSRIYNHDHIAQQASQSFVSPGVLRCRLSSRSTPSV